MRRRADIPRGTFNAPREATNFPRSPSSGSGSGYRPSIGTSFPDTNEARFALNTSKRAPTGKTHRRTASQLLAVAARDAGAWHSRRDAAPQVDWTAAAERLDALYGDGGRYPGRFVRWAEPPPEAGVSRRGVIIDREGAIRWVRVPADENAAPSVSSATFATADEASAAAEEAAVNRRGDFPAPRTCEGCKKPKGTTPIFKHGYWHLRCWAKTSDAKRATVAERLRVEMLARRAAREGDGV